MEKSIFVFTGIIIREDKGYSSLCLDLDIASQRETIKEAKDNLIEAVTLYIETAIENNLPLLRPVPKEDNPLDTRPNDVVDIFKLNVDLQVRTYA